MAFRREKRGRTLEAALDMTPLIDVVFLLVIFLHISTTFKKRQLSLELDLPRVGQTEFRSSGTEHQLRIANDGAMYLCPEQTTDGTDSPIACDERVNQAALDTLFRDLSKKYPGIRLGVYADGDVSYRLIVKVVAAATESGLDPNLPYELEPSSE